MIRPAFGFVFALATLFAEMHSGACLEFEIRKDKRSEFVAAHGEIRSGDARTLRSFLERSSSISYISLKSPGGSLAEGIRIGQLIRDRRLGTIVNEDVVCASACVFVFAGGVIREAHPRAKIGVHMASAMFSDNAYVSALKKLLTVRDLSLDDRIRLIISLNEQRAAQALSLQAAYLQTMGVSMNLLFNISSTHHLEMKWLSARELRDLNLVNADWNG